MTTELPMESASSPGLRSTASTKVTPSGREATSPSGGVGACEQPATNAAAKSQLMRAFMNEPSNCVSRQPAASDFSNALVRANEPRLSSPAG